jgi:serine/threonine-protein kinase
MIGQTLGRYRIEEKIGAGGMGDVYRAHDSKLGRNVAIKVLPETFARDAERLTRFEQEARLLASLNHLNIAAIYGLEESDGQQFLVLELVPGPTLAERLSSGPLPSEEAQTVCGQIAEAIEAAHDRGIIHRDLKPSNIKVTPDGKVKVLDFGLAKAFAGDESAFDLSRSPTISQSATRAGTLLGTPAYMSPEQARGKPVDKRTDIWAFGCVLYECLTSKQAFSGETVSDTLAKILTSEPDWTALPAETPPTVQHLLRRCLQKNANRRLRDIGDARIEMEEPLATPATPSVPAGRPQPRWRETIAWVVASLMAVLAVAVVTWHQVSIGRRQFSAKLPARVVIPLSETEPVDLETLQPAVALSPDGTKIVYVANHGGKRQLYVRELNKSQAELIPGSEGAYNPFFSRDGRWVGFFSGWLLKKVSLAGGAPVPLLAVPPVTRGASWGPDDTIVFTTNPNGGLSQISAVAENNKGWWRAGRDVRGPPNPAIGEYSHRWAEFLPGRRVVLFTIDTGGSFDDARIGVLDLKTGKTKVVLEGGTNARYARSGHLVFARAGRLLAVVFDLERLEAAGEPVAVVENVAMEPEGAAQFALSEEGTLAYVSGRTSVPLRKLVWVNRRGEAEALPAPPRSYMNPALSPNGRRVAVTIFDGSNYEIWISDVSRGTLTRETFDPGEDFSPVWNPDGRRITFSSEVGGTAPQLFWAFADGSGRPEKMIQGQPTLLVDAPGSYSPGGSVLAYVQHEFAVDIDSWTKSDISFLRLQGQRKPEPFLHTAFNEYAPRFSPDGRWLAYVSDESGRDEVYVQAFPGPSGKVQVSIEGGTEPVWNPRGRELFYRNGQKMMVVTVTTNPTFTASKPRLLFEKPYAMTYRPDAWQNYDVSPDGQHFLMVKAEQELAATQINVVLNWFEELKRRVPPAKR